MRFLVSLGTSLCLLMALLLFVIPSVHAEGTIVQVKSASADWVNGEMRILIIFEQQIPPSLEDVVKRPATYLVKETVPNSNGGSSSNTIARNSRIRRVELDSGKTLVSLYLLGQQVLDGQVTIAGTTIGGDSLKQDSVEWTLDTPYRTSPPTFDLSPSFQESNLVVSINAAQTTKYRWKLNSEGVPVRVKRDFYSVAGVVPVGRPNDIKVGSRARDEATTGIANYLEANYKWREFHGRTTSSIGGVVRTNGRLRGPEVVVQWQPYAGFIGTQAGSTFGGLELEGGWRDGTQEWVNLSANAPNRGNFVARLGGILEYAPQLGPINQDKGSGLRFFVRGRGWIDYANDDQGKKVGRMRAFLDSEVFYNITANYRFFARYELGYLPPDLSRRRNGLSFGVGASF